MKWTKEQDEILMECGNHGPDECAEIIYARTGRRHTVEAVRRHAYRIGASLVVYSICPGCGKKAAKVNKHDGLCRTCHERELAQEQRRINSKLRAEIAALDSEDEYRRAVSEHAKVRQENSRLCRKYGLPGKRERKEESYG